MAAACCQEITMYVYFLLEFNLWAYVKKRNVLSGNRIELEIISTYIVNYFGQNTPFK